MGLKETLAAAVVAGSAAVANAGLVEGVFNFTLPNSFPVWLQNSGSGLLPGANLQARYIIEDTAPDTVSGPNTGNFPAALQSFSITSGNFFLSGNTGNIRVTNASVGVDRILYLTSGLNDVDVSLGLGSLPPPSFDNVFEGPLTTLSSDVLNNATNTGNFNSLTNVSTLNFSQGRIPLTFQNVAFTNIPSPGAAALLALGGVLVATSGRKRDSAVPTPVNG